MNDWVAISRSPEETRGWGCRLGCLAEAGLVVLLSGALGAGKTCFAQGVAAGLGVATDSPVVSPSYALLHHYQGRCPLYHFDLYRLATVEDLAELGYDEIAEGDGVTLVEWADRLAVPLPAALQVELLSLDRDRREIRFVARDNRGRKLLTALAASAITL